MTTHFHLYFLSIGRYGSRTPKHRRKPFFDPHWLIFGRSRTAAAPAVYRHMVSREPSTRALCLWHNISAYSLSVALSMEGRLQRRARSFLPQRCPDHNVADPGLLESSRPSDPHKADGCAEAGECSGFSKDQPSSRTDVE
jgi:hypothetical protein